MRLFQNISITNKVLNHKDLKYETINYFVVLEQCYKIESYVKQNHPELNVKEETYNRLLNWTRAYENR